MSSYSLPEMCWYIKTNVGASVKTRSWITYPHLRVLSSPGSFSTDWTTTPTAF
jgi:hypothetical protein